MKSLIEKFLTMQEGLCWDEEGSSAHSQQCDELKEPEAEKRKKKGTVSFWGVLNLQYKSFFPNDFVIFTNLSAVLLLYCTYKPTHFWY